MWMGEQGREICKTFVFEGNQADDPAVVLKKLEDYVKPLKNKRVARYKAHQRGQQEGETFDTLSKICAFC